jgi:hypothetical protein
MGGFARRRKAGGLLAVLAEWYRAGALREQGGGDMKICDVPKSIRGWIALAKEKRETDEQTQRIVNAFFFSVTIFSVAFAYFVLSARPVRLPPSARARITP